MVSAKQFRSACLALEDSSEAPHFERAAFRTTKRIYATLAADGTSANLRLHPDQQAALTSSRPDAFTPIDNAWGRQGWTTVDLTAVDVATLKDALAWAHAGALASKPSRPSPRKKKRARR